jgi:hypothetical protein
MKIKSDSQERKLFLETWKVSLSYKEKVILKTI